MVKLPAEVVARSAWKCRRDGSATVANDQKKLLSTVMTTVEEVYRLPKTETSMFASQCGEEAP